MRTYRVSRDRVSRDMSARISCQRRHRRESARTSPVFGAPMRRMPADAQIAHLADVLDAVAVLLVAVHHVRGHLLDVLGPDALQVRLLEVAPADGPP